MMKKILHVLSGNVTVSGVASYLYQQYLYIDREKIHYDFFFCKENSMELVMNDPIFHDSQFYVVNARTKKTGSTNYLKIMHELNRILNETKYDAVVINTSVVMIIYACLRVVRRHNGVRFIAHAHNTGLVLNKGALRNKIMPIMNAVDNVLRKRIRKGADALFSCSSEAGKATFGESAVKLDKFRILRNAIDIEKFRYKSDISSVVRQEMSIKEGTLVIGNVGRLARIKNQTFLIQIFALIHKEKPDSRLWLIGDGPDKDMLTSMAKEYGLDNDVEFLGQKTEIYRYMQAMDVFIFPSLSEGLGIVAIEAQAAGLPTIVSDGVPNDVLLTPLAKMISLAEKKEKWTEEIFRLHKDFPKHMDCTETLMAAGYDIVTETNTVMQYYLSIS